MPSYLYRYKHSASNRENKFLRAVKSVIYQTYKNWELIIVADGCVKTESLYRLHYATNLKIKYKYILKQDLFSGNVRNEGLQIATGDIVTYLDSDDYYSVSHLDNVINGFMEQSCDFGFWNDYVLTGTAKRPNTIMRNTELLPGKIGTSCIAHLRALPISWLGCDGYGHDWTFIQRLMQISSNYKKIYGTGYTVCHIKDRIDL